MDGTHFSFKESGGRDKRRSAPAICSADTVANRWRVPFLVVRLDERVERPRLALNLRGQSETAARPTPSLVDATATGAPGGIRRLTIDRSESDRVQPNGLLIFAAVSKQLGRHTFALTPRPRPPPFHFPSSIGRTAVVPPFFFGGIFPSSRRRGSVTNPPVPSLITSGLVRPPQLGPVRCRTVARIQFCKEKKRRNLRGCSLKKVVHIVDKTL